MRIKWPKEPLPDERRVRSGFLILPKTIGRETRWLEKATWLEEVLSPGRWVFDWRVPIPKWETVKWVDQK